MAHGEQFTLFTHFAAPNGWKVAFILNSLGLSYESRYLDMNTVKSPEHTKYNPNGRIPTMIDHKNNDFVIWESGAIILYLVDRYDPDHQVSVASPNDRAILTQWLFFQVSGQGPYFGQATWFAHMHHEKLPSAIERYRNEVRRVLGVLEGVLRDREYLVGGKLTVADIAFVPFDNALKSRILGGDFDFQKEFPSTFAWHTRVTTATGVKKGIEDRVRVIAEEEEKKANAPKA